MGLWELFFLTITRPWEAFARITPRQGIKLFLILVLLAGFALVQSQLPFMEDVYAKSFVEQLGLILGSVFLTFIITITSWLAMSLILFFLVGGVQGEFVDALGIIGVAWVPLFFYYLLRAAYTTIAGEPFVIENDYALALFENLNPFVLWSVALQTIGFTVVYKSSIRRAGIFTVLYRVMLMLGSLLMTYRVLF